MGEKTTDKSSLANADSHNDELANNDKSYKGKMGYTFTKDLSSLNLSQIPQSKLTKKTFIFGNNELFALKAKIEKIGTPLKEWDICINYGIKTGYNEAFIIDTKTKDEILANCDDTPKSAIKSPSLAEGDLGGGSVKNTQNSTNALNLSKNSKENSQNSKIENSNNAKNTHPQTPSAREGAFCCEMLTERQRTARLIKPILRGRDIKRYSYEWANLWLINTHNGYEIQGVKIPPIDIKDYPALKKHLDGFYEKLEKKG